MLLYSGHKRILMNYSQWQFLQTFLTGSHLADHSELKSVAYLSRADSDTLAKPTVAELNG